MCLTPTVMFSNVIKGLLKPATFIAAYSTKTTTSKELIEFGEYLTKCLPKFIEKVTISRGIELNVHVPVSGLLPTLEFLRDHGRCQYKQLMDMTAVDWVSANNSDKKRFELVYCLLSIKHNSRLVLHTHAESSIHPSVPSVTHLFPSANWSERETFDLFGIIFEGHPDLRRIMTDYGFEGHPLRKDFPLTGFVEVRYDEEYKRVIEEPLEMTQEFRKFEYSSPVITNNVVVFNMFFSGNKFQKRKKLNLNRNKVFPSHPSNNNTDL